jgi:hypothetical protein
MPECIYRFKTFDGRIFNTQKEAMVYESTLLPRCKICGGLAIYHRSEGGESTHHGSVEIYCESCKQSVICYETDQQVVLPKGSSCWDYTYEKLRIASGKAIAQWKTLMATDDQPEEVPTPAFKEMEENTYWAHWELDTLLDPTIPWKGDENNGKSCS